MFFRRFLIAAATVVISSYWIANAEDKPKKPWKNATELSMVSANGNTKSQTTSGKNTFNYDWTKVGLEIIGGGMGARSAGVTIAEKYFASEKVSYKIKERNYIFEKFAWDKDRFAGIRNRNDASAGAGREFVKTDRHLFLSEAGAGWIDERRIGDKDKDFIAGRLYSKYAYTISPTSTFSQDAEYLHNFEDPDDFRVNTETSLTAAITAAMALKLTYVWKYVGVPPAGFGRNDTITAVALVASF